jgi:hypothetical protein
VSSIHSPQPIMTAAKAVETTGRAPLLHSTIASTIHTTKPKYRDGRDCGQ